MFDYGTLIITRLVAFIEQITVFLSQDLTLFGMPAIYYMVFGLVISCIYKFLLSPIFSGGVSAGASDTVKFASNVVSNNQNDKGKWRDR